MNSIIELNQNEITTVAGGGAWDWISHVGAGCYTLGGALCTGLGVFFIFYVKNHQDAEATTIKFLSVVCTIFGLGAFWKGVDHFVVKFGSSVSVDGHVQDN